MKKIYLVLLVAVALFAQNNSFAQFNLPKKKGATTKVSDKSTTADPAPEQQ